MLRQGHSTGFWGCSYSAKGILVILLAICLAECVSEQRINNRGSKASHLVEKINGWRSQRGGSCLSYGHSCWGAHGKRSNQPSSAPDWFITRLLRRMATSNEMNRGDFDGNDVNAIYEISPNGLGNEPMNDEDLAQRVPDAKPMLDNDAITKLKFWQVLKAASTE